MTDKTLIYDTYEDFLRRGDKSLNGVSQEFAEQNEFYAVMNRSNKGCWNCIDCMCCVDCRECTHCNNCTNCDSCEDCNDRTNLVNHHHVATSKESPDIPTKQNNAAVSLLDKLGVSGEEEEIKAIPCGYQEAISEGKTLTCGNAYRGEIFYCRDCMKGMLSNAHEISNAMAEILLVAYNDHANDGKVSNSTIYAMQSMLETIGCVHEVEESKH